ncbi:glycosyltransferase family 4 protein [Aquirhabdus parva]|nr:glycosyltransferase family 4 protein [Aquirhabdus parva]
MQSNVVPKIAIILPSRERFRSGDAGAVALTVYEFCKASRYADELVVFGGCAEHFPEVRYQHVAVSFAWLRGRNRAYGLKCLEILREHSEIKLIEVHNRARLALALKKVLPNRRVTIHLHNDPQGMAGVKTVADREKLLRTVDHVYCVSKFVKMRLLEGVDPALGARVEVVYNAILSQQNNDELTLTPPTVRQPWIVYAGRFIPEKGVLELAQSLAKILPQFPDWRVVFLGAWGFGHEAGKSAYEQSVYAALKDVADQIDFRGHVPHSEVMSVFNQSSIAVSPSTGAEAFGRTTLEAMDAGCAVVTSMSCGLKEVAGDAAIVIPQVTIEALSDAIIPLMQQSGLRQLCADRCQQRAREVFSLPVQIEHLDAARDALIA